MHVTIEINSFKVIYKYDLELKLRLENKIIKEEIFVIKILIKRFNTFIS